MVCLTRSVVVGDVHRDAVDTLPITEEIVVKLNQLDVITPDVPKATTFLTALLGIEPKVAEERFAEFDIGGFTLMLSPDAMVPVAPARGVILHVEVADVDAAVKRAQAAGAIVLQGPQNTDWGTYSVLVAGPEETVLDLYQPNG
jgi:predicted enzyme related to lactoylglutathione lyase